MHLGNRIHQLRKENGLSQEQLAEKMGVSRQAVSKWELGESTPDTDKIIGMSQLFDVSTDYLLGNQMETPEEQSAQKTESSIGFLARFINERGYIAGYILAGYAAALFFMTRLGHFMFEQMVMPPDGFEITVEELPTSFTLPLTVLNILSIVAVIGFIAGLVLSFRLKNKKSK